VLHDRELWTEKASVGSTQNHVRTVPGVVVSQSIASPMQNIVVLPLKHDTDRDFEHVWMK
jgi:hypothetical protein